MQICIHRGQNQIGGSIIEIKTDSTRIFLDVGMELDESEHIDVPQIEGLFCGEKNCDAVFISHYHGDHIGLLNHILPNTPLFMGESAYKIFSASADYRNLEVKSSPIFIYHKERVTDGKHLTQTLATGRTLATRFLAQEVHIVSRDLAHAAVVVHDDHAAGAHHGPVLLERVEVHR